MLQHMSLQGVFCTQIITDKGLWEPERLPLTPSWLNKLISAPTPLPLDSLGLETFGSTTSPWNTIVFRPNWRRTLSWDGVSGTFDFTSYKMGHTHIGEISADSWNRFIFWPSKCFPETAGQGAQMSMLNTDLQFPGFIFRGPAKPSVVPSILVYQVN